MFDLGLMELLVIGVTALIVVGPKDLPVMFRTVGRFTGKMKGMAREFSRAMNDAADDAGVKDLSADLRKMTNPSKLGLDTVRDAAKDFAKFDPEKEAERAARTPGPAVAKMTEERAEAARKIREKSAEVALARQAREAEAASEAAELSDEPDIEPAPAPVVETRADAPPAVETPREEKSA